MLCCTERTVARKFPAPLHLKVGREGQQRRGGFIIAEKGLKEKRGRVGLLLVLPVIIWYAIFFWGPLVFTFVTSLMKWNMIDQSKFVGLGNYKKLFLDPAFLHSFSISLIYTMSTTGLLVFFGLTFAILFDRPGPIASLARMLFFMTAILPLVGAGAIWVWIAGPEPYSALNSLMSFLGMSRKSWLNDPKLALLCVIGFVIWKNTGFNALIYTAGLRAMPSVYIDAARLDGASRFRLIKDIMIPVLKPITLFLIVTNMINGWSMFTVIWFLTKGGPGTATKVLPAYVYQYGFGRFQFGFASASAMMLIGVAFVFTYIQLKKL